MKKTNINIFKFSAGFTFPELIVSLGILLLVFIMITINVSPLPANTLLDSNLDTLLADVRSQQALAMSDSENYGIYFGSQSYTLFKGDTYVAGSAGNFTVNMDEGVGLINVTFPGSVILFSAGSGDVANYTMGSDSLTIQSSITQKYNIVRINKYGATY